MGAAPILRRSLTAFVAAFVAILTAAAGASTSTTPSVSTTTLSDGDTVAGAVRWEAHVANATAKSVDFYVDGKRRWSERNAPFVFNGNTGLWDSTTESNGKHDLSLRLTTTSGAKYYSSISVTVANGGGGSSGSGDTTAPTAPSGLAVKAATATSLSLTWKASNDNVGVAGYGVYVGDKLVGSAAGTTSSLDGLTCGTTYTVAVDAYDAAANRSPKAQATAATAACTSTTPPPPPATAAQHAVSTSGSDSNPCTRAAPCKTFNAAYRAASPGEVVEVAAGTYPGQAISSDSSKTSATDVIFRPAEGATVTVSGELEITAKHLELRDMSFRYRVLAGAADVTLRNIVARGAIKIVSNGSAFPRDISVLGGEIGPGADSDSQIGSNGTATTASPTNILFDGVYFHDFTVSAGSSAHVECLQVWAADGLTIRNSRFKNCHHFNIFIQKLPNGAAATPSNILIENNTMDCCGGGHYAVRLSDTHGGSWKNVTIRNNSANKAFNLGPKVPYSNVHVIGNIAPKLDGTPAGATIDYNVWYAGKKVGANDQVAPHGFRDLARLDFHLKDGAAAVDRGHPTSYPSTDLDGERRPNGARADAGADELGAGGSAPPPDQQETPPPPPPSDPPPPPTPAPSPPATAATVFVSTGGSDAGSCTSSAPCKTFNRAYRVARPGQTVEVAGGSYPDQTIGVDASKTSADDVVFRPAAGATVKVNELWVDGAHIEFRDLKIADDWRAAEGSHDLTFRNVDAARFYVSSATNVRVLGGRFGPSVNKVVQIKPADGGPPSRNVLIDGAYFFDFYATDPDQHMECIHVMGVDGLTIRNSRFNRCEHFDVFFKRFSSSAGTPRNILLENNWFQKTHPEGHWAVRFSETGPWENVTIRHNSFAQGLSVANVRLVNFRIEANVGTSHPCHDDATYAYNVWANGKCGSTDAQAPTGFVDQAGFDFRLTAGARAVDFVPSSTLTRDIDGRPRPSGARYDAGASER